MKNVFSRKGHVFMHVHAFLTVALLSAIVLPAHAQSQSAASRGIVSPAGGMLRHAGASLSWTVGDLSAGQYTTPEVRLREGFLSVPLQVTRVAPLPAAWDVSLFPNPVSADLTVAIRGTHPAIALQLFDLAGRVLAHTHVHENSGSGRLSMRQLPPGSYFLRVFDAAGAASAVYQVKKIK